MEHTRSNFRALRETVGISQLNLANRLGVNKQSVKRWENPRFDAGGYNMPPDDAWNVLDDAREMQKKVVDHTIEAAKKLEADHGSSATLSLAYWRTQEDYDEAHSQEEHQPFEMANANSRQAGAMLERYGYTVNYNCCGLKKL
jgi:transcriptional regulator with XRE-family HTH domain